MLISLGYSGLALLPNKNAYQLLSLKVEMENTRFLIVVFLAISLIWAGRPLSSQERPVQSVNVIAVEIPVRVFRGHEFVTGLTREDFEIYENGIRQDITGFEAISKTIDYGQVVLSERNQRAQGKRNFVLIFNVYDYTDSVGEAIEYFFKDIFNKGDRLIVIVEDKVLEVDSDEAAAAKIKDYLARYKKISRAEIWKAFHYLEERAQSLVALLTGTGATDYPTNDAIQAIGQFIRQYQVTWADYRKRMLDVDLELYKAIIRKLERVDGERWTICFQQRDLFPKLKSQGRLDRELNVLLERDTLVRPQWEELSRSFDISRKFPAEQILQLFTEANITFHLLIFKSRSLPTSHESQELDLRDVNSDYEDILSRISRKTGGLAFYSNNILDGIKAAAAKEAQYYMLVYQPKDQTAAKERKINIKVGREGVEVIALKEYVRYPPPAITISGFVSKHKTVTFKIENATRPLNKSQGLGRAMIRVSLFNANSSRVFDQSRVLDLTDETTRISLNLDKLHSGYHLIIIEAFDLISGQKDVFSMPIEL